MPFKIAYEGEWIRVRNMMNSKVPVNGPCSICRGLRVEVVWYSIKTGEIRCKRCFNPEGYAPSLMESSRHRGPK